MSLMALFCKGEEWEWRGSDAHEIQPFSPAAYALAAKHAHSVFVSKAGKPNEDGEVPPAAALQQLMLYSVGNLTRLTDMRVSSKRSLDSALIDPIPYSLSLVRAGA